MLHVFGWAALAVLAGYLVLFFAGGVMAARAAGRPVWLFDAATGRDRLATMGFRLAFTLALVGPLLWLIVPVLHKADTLWTEGRVPLLGFAGLAMAAVGSVLALAAQRAMGASWRVGVKAGETGALVQGGLFRLSRNPTFLGQGLLLTGVALAIPSVPMVLGLALFLWSARTQVLSEEAALMAANGDAYGRFMQSVPRWIGLPRQRKRLFEHDSATDPQDITRP